MSGNPPKVAVHFKRTENDQYHCTVNMRANKTFDAAIKAACDTRSWFEDDFIFEFEGGNAVLVTDTPISLVVTKHVTILCTKKVAHVIVHFDIDNQLKEFTLKIKLTDTIMWVINKAYTLHCLTDVYKYTYISGEDVLEFHTPITQGMVHKDNIIIVSTKIQPPNPADKRPHTTEYRERVTRSRREF